MELLLLAIILAFSEKNPPFSFSFSIVTSSDPLAIVLIVSEMVFFLTLAAYLSSSVD